MRGARHVAAHRPAVRRLLVRDHWSRTRGAAALGLREKGPSAVQITARPEQDVDEARRLMAEHELDRVLVTAEGDRLVGIISEGDLRADEGPVASS